MNRLVTLFVAIFVIVMLASSTMFVVDQRRYAMVFSLGEVHEVVGAPGLHFKLPPPLQNVVYLDKRLLTLETPDNDRYPTADKKDLQVDSYVKWRIADTTTYYRATGGQQLVAMDRLSSIVNRNLRDQFGSMTIQQAVSGERNALMTSLEKATEDKVKDLGIQIVDVRVKRIDLPKPPECFRGDGACKARIARIEPGLVQHIVDRRIERSALAQHVGKNGLRRQPRAQFALCRFAVHAQGPGAGA